jgi:glutamate synthase (ferredoxin)
VASGRFGVSINYLTSAKEIQIKWHKALSQVKEDNYREKSSTMDRRGTKLNTICWFNFTTHHDIYSIEDLSQLIFDLKMRIAKLE